MRVGTTLLHDHLDGGLRPQTLLDLAAEGGYAGLPARTPEAVADWFVASASGTLTDYLATFRHTGAVMQTASALRRVAFEAAVDCSEVGVRAAEFRFAPTQHLAGGLVLDEVIAAVLAGLDEARSATAIESGLIVCAVRPMDDSVVVAEAAARWSNEGVVGFDLCAAEIGFPHDLHREALSLCVDRGVPITIHAGEDLGPESIDLALRCRASRIGHGIAVVDDCRWDDTGSLLDAGPVASRLLDEQIPLEVCITSNLQTKRWAADAHPFGRMYRAGFNVTLNTDNRLQSATDLAAEFQLAAETFDLNDEDLEQIDQHAIDAVFS
ncbi:MAG: adenosine deaminase family protein [Acidimicrobiia bacterium]